MSGRFNQQGARRGSRRIRADSLEEWKEKLIEEARANRSGKRGKTTLAVLPISVDFTVTLLPEVLYRVSFAVEVVLKGLGHIGGLADIAHHHGSVLPGGDVVLILDDLVLLTVHFNDSRGWFCRHFHAAMAFARDNPKVVRKAYSETAGELNRKFDAEWRKKVRQFQMPLFSFGADGAWIIRFDDVIADALELEPLRQGELKLSEELRAKIESVRPEELPAEVIHTLNAYYVVNRPEDSDWVVLPVANFDCWFRDTNFGRKYLSQISEEIVQRSSSFGVSRYRVLPEFLP